MIDSRNLLAFWGKASPLDGTTVPVHPLVAHALDVAAVASNLPTTPPIAIAPAMLTLLVSLHDIGKFSRSFQVKSPAGWPVGVLGPYPADKPPPNMPHDLVGLALLSGDIGQRLGPLFPDWCETDLCCLWRALAGHHGRPPDPSRFSQLNAAVVDDPCRAAAGTFVDAMIAVFQPLPWPRPVSDIDIERFSWWLAGLTTLADWIGSRQSWFPYVAAMNEPAAYYREIAVPAAIDAVARAGIAPSMPAPFAGLRGLFPTIAEATPIQLWAENAALPGGPTLTVIEDLTGSGKTEAALTLAHRLLSQGRADGVFFALPTMATANAMFERMSASYRALFAPDTNPSLALAHGHATLHAGFAKTIDGGSAPSQRTTDPADEPAESHCAAWLAEDRRRTLMAQVGVGTLDQALLAVLPVRHATLRLFGIARKVLIVDEVHAFDAYMREELATLLRFHAAMGGSAILLSATLAKQQRGMLTDAFQDGLGIRKSKRGKLLEDAYPLATMASATGIAETYCPPRAHLPRRVTVTRVPDSAAASTVIVDAARQGAAVVWIRNTVDDAISAADAVRALGLTPLLFHARFAMGDRLRIENEVLRRFGRDSAAPDRACVLVATQVVEQSLDIDFDTMVTDLAPADLLIQRAGRLWRHKRHQRPVPGPALSIVSPEPIPAPTSDWIRAVLPGTAAVYADHAMLWRSARAVFGRGAIVTPDDMRGLIEEVFEGDVPDGLQTASGTAEGIASAHTSLARQNVLSLKGGYDAHAGAWDPETRTPTRLEDRPHVTLRLALMRDGAIRPYADNPDPTTAWALSEVSVAQYRIASCPVPAGLTTAFDIAKRGWGRWERESPFVVLALLTPDGDGYTLAARSEAGRDFIARYDVQRGLSWSDDVPAVAG